MRAERFEQLEVWQQAHQLTLSIYIFTRQLPRDERYGLVSQMRRAAVSVPANITEGFKRRGRQDKARFYNIAQSSLEELRYYVYLCKDLSYGVDHDDFEPIIERVARMLYCLEQSVLSR